MTIYLRGHKLKMTLLLIIHLVQQMERLYGLEKVSGGGTLHFGLQYIDTQDLINHNFNKFNDKEGFDSIVDSVNDITNADKYDYSKNGDNYTPNQKYYELKEFVDNRTATTGVKMYNNKIYNTNTDTNERLLLGDLVTNMPNIDISYNVSVCRILFNNPQDASIIQDFNGKTYHAHNYILCAGAIQTPAILQRSGIDCGNKLYDHAGLTFLYGKVAPVSQQTTTPYSGNGDFVLNKSNLQKIYNEFTLCLLCYWWRCCI